MNQCAFLGLHLNYFQLNLVDLLVLLRAFRILHSFDVSFELEVLIDPRLLLSNQRLYFLLERV